MLARLARGPVSVSDLARPLTMSLPAVMQHLAVLECSGLVRTEKLGRVRTCRVDVQTLKLAEHWLNRQRSEWEARLDRLGDYLQTIKKEGARHGRKK